MQKKLIALAIAGLASSAAFAQTNVTIYGVADATFEFAKASGATVGDVGNVAGQTRLASNSSLIGFKGVEDLGNGLKAVFQFEAGVDFTGNNDGAGTSGLFNGQVRDSYVGLTGGFGTVVAGTLTHPIRAFGAAVDFNPGASSAGFTGSMYGEFLGVKTGTDERARNAVAYISPSFSGFTVVGAYVSGGINAANDASSDAQNSAQNAKGSTNSQQYQLAAQYANGGLFAGLGYHHAQDPRALTAVLTALGATALVGQYNDKLTDWRAVGKYTFSTGTSISGLYDRQKYSFDTTSILGDGNNAKRTAWQVGVNQAFGKNNVYLQYAAAGKAKINGDNVDGTSAHQWTLGYTYDLSKRTMVHAFYTELRNQENVHYDNYVNGLATGTAGADNKVLGAGIRHSF